MKEQKMTNQLKIPTFSGIREAKPMGAGERLFAFTKWTENVTRAGDPAVILSFSCLAEGDDNGRKVSRFFALSENAIGYLKTTLLNLGYPPDSEETDLGAILDSVLEKQIYLTVGIQKRDGVESNTVLGSRPVTD